VGAGRAPRLDLTITDSVIAARAPLLQGDYRLVRVVNIQHPHRRQCGQHGAEAGGEAGFGAEGAIGVLVRAAFPTLVNSVICCLRRGGAAPTGSWEGLCPD